MVKAKSFWPFQTDTTGQSSNCNCMISALEHNKSGLPAGIHPGTITFSANTVTQNFGVPATPNLMICDDNGDRGLPRDLYPPFQILHPAADQCQKENLFCSPGLGTGAEPNALAECQRRFLIFDQSGNKTRLVYDRSFSAPLKPNTAPTKRFNYHCINFDEDAVKGDQIDQIKLTIHKGLDENHISEDESDMQHEDTEEINALLYSDDDFSEDYGNEDEDDLTSTGHSPYLISGSLALQEDNEKLIDDVGSSEVPNKRLKLLDGRCMSPTLVDTASSLKVDEHYCHKFSAESTQAKCQTPEEESLSTFGKERTKKDKLHATLDILKSIIPGVKDRDPLSVLDSAIIYLNSLKVQAKSLGVNYY